MSRYLSTRVSRRSYNKSMNLIETTRDKSPLRILLTGKETKAKLRAVKLQSYWKKICDDEKRSKQRNAQLLRDLDRMETNMANLEARREKLRQLKQQYWDYIDRTYPHWMELVEQKKREQQQQQQQQRQQQQQELIQQQQQQRLKQQQEEIIQQQQQQRLQQQQQEQQQQQQRLQQQQQEERLKQQQYQQQQQMILQEKQQRLQQQRQQVFEQEEDIPPPLPTSPPPPLAFSAGYNDNFTAEPEREYTNLKNVSRQSPTTAPKQPIMASVTVHMPENPQGEFNTPVIQRRDAGGRKGEQPNQNWLPAERDPSVHSVSYSEEVSVPIIQPIQSVTVRQKQPEQKMAPSMVPPGTGSDEDISDFGDDVDLPSGEALPPPLPEGRPPSPRGSPEQDTQVKQVLADSDSQGQEPESLSSVLPEISTQGILRLLKYVEDDIGDALSVEGYYRTRNPDSDQRKAIIYKANSMGALQGLDAEYVSMVILEQLTPVIRNLPGACILPDVLLIRNAANGSESQIRSQLHKDAQELWDKLLEHFVCLVKNRAMGTREVAYVFVPCLAHDSSQHQDKAVSLIERVVEQMVAGGDARALSPVQDSMVDTARSSLQNGVVPPLKFGSLVDSKPFSDEESSMITQSMPTEGPKVPLNETEAYKSLVSGSMGAKRPQPAVVSDDTDDNSDNDLEKQFVSTLSPRSHASKTPHESEQPAEPSKSSEIPPVSESHDQADDQEPLSELGDLPGISPVYVPTGVERSTGRSGLGSTGGSSQQRKLAGMISSDIDTDTEVDLDKMGTKKSEFEDDDDFHDFYQ